MKRHRLWYSLVTSAFCEALAVALGHAVASSGCQGATADQGKHSLAEGGPSARPQIREHRACGMYYDL